MRTGTTTLNTDWLKGLDAATTIEQAIQVVEDFVESRSDVYWAGVPEALRRPRIANEAQLQQWHHALVQAISMMPSPGSPMQELAVFSLRAAVRIHQIHLREERAKPSNEGGFDASPGRGFKQES